MIVDHVRVGTNGDVGDDRPLAGLRAVPYGMGPPNGREQPSITSPIFVPPSTFSVPLLVVVGMAARAPLRCYLPTWPRSYNALLAWCGRMHLPFSL